MEHISLTDLSEIPGSLELFLAGAVVESGGVLVIRRASWDSPVIQGKKLAIEVSDDDTLTITLEEDNGNSF